MAFAKEDCVVGTDELNVKAEIEKQIPPPQTAEDLLAAGKPQPEGRDDRLKWFASRSETR